LLGATFINDEAIGEKRTLITCLSTYHDIGV